MKPNHPPISKSRLKRLIAEFGGDWPEPREFRVEETAPTNAVPTSRAPVSHGDPAPGHLTEDEA